MEQPLDTYIEVIEFPFTAQGEEIEKELELKRIEYNTIIGISANIETGRTQEVQSCIFDTKEVLFGSGTLVAEAFGGSLVSSVTDRFFPCKISYKKGDEFKLKLKDTTSAGFAAYTQKVHLLIAKIEEDDSTNS